MKIDPIQLSEKLVDNTGMLTRYFNAWFRNLSITLKEAQTIISATPNYQYCLNGNLLTINYSGNGNEELNLPHKIAENQVINYWDNNVLKMLEISKNDLKINVPNGVIKFTATILIRVS